jgi:hypothetical protein
MQLPQAVTGWRTADRLPGALTGSPAYYGFGLFVDEDPAFGRVVSHSGGYPGFGSNMRWHPATGLAVIALGNATYARMNAVAERVLGALLPPAPGYQVALSPRGEPWPETLAAQESVSRLLLGWDDAAADALFCENVALDQPYQERVADLALLRERIGDFTADPFRPAQSDTPAHRRWWLTGERGTVAVAIQLNPERPPRVQSVGIAMPPEPGSPLAGALAALVAWLNDAAADWPAGLAVAPSADASLIARRLRMAAAWAGRVTPGAFPAGDGSSSAMVELTGEHATVTLSVVIDPLSGQLRQADIAV